MIEIQCPVKVAWDKLSGQDEFRDATGEVVEYRDIADALNAREAEHEELVLLRAYFDTAHEAVLQGVDEVQAHVERAQKASRRVLDWRAAHPEVRP